MSVGGGETEAFSPPSPKVKLIPVDLDKPHFRHAAVLLELLERRAEVANISHRKMPTYDEHLAFIRSKPYHAWYMVGARQALVGTIYLTNQDEVGITINQGLLGLGYGQAAVKALMKAHPKKAYFANVAPRNKASRGFFEKLGFKLMHATEEQNTYILEDDDGEI